MDCKNIFGRPVDFILRQDQITQVRAHPEGMERNVAREDCTPVNLEADCLPNAANTEPTHQPDDVQPVADNDQLDVSALEVMMANTTLQREFEIVSDQDHSQVMHRRVVAETDVEAVDETFDAVLAGADD